MPTATKPVRTSARAMASELRERIDLLNISLMQVEARRAKLTNEEGWIRTQLNTATIRLHQIEHPEEHKGA